jgi:hypothetical protein
MSKNRKIKNFNFNVIQVVTLIIIFSMIIFGIIIINNINSEYKTRRIAGEMQRYKYSILSFNNIYSGLPGDLETATFYWKEITKDGDGNRQIGSLPEEKVLAWQHLQLSGQINFENKMTGRWAEEEREDSYKVGLNIPKSEKTEHNISYIIGYSDEEKRNYIKIISLREGNILGSLTPNEANLIDLAIDDGYPETGNVKSIGYEDGDCYFAGEYKDSDSKIECIVILNI